MFVLIASNFLFALKKGGMASKWPIQISSYNNINNKLKTTCLQLNVCIFCLRNGAGLDINK